MQKQHEHGNTKNCRCDTSPANTGIREQADNYLFQIVSRDDALNNLRAQYEAAIKEVDKQFAVRIASMESLKDNSEKALKKLMKFNKAILFAGTDVVNLPNGSLIHHEGEKVSIPHGALEACKLNGFKDVIKTVESLDRDAVEKWPDAKLMLIGATRKPFEEFNFSIKEVKKTSIADELQDAGGEK
jgi:hypothetical protein